jgi:hypothetical protein
MIKINLQQICNLSSVYSVIEWRSGNCHRAYINLRNVSPHHNGDKSFKFWVDFVDGTFNWKRGRGVTSTPFDETRRELEASLGLEKHALHDFGKIKMADPKDREKDWDNIQNEGCDGYNPYR